MPQIPFEDIPEYTGTETQPTSVPGWAIVREVDFEVRGAELWFYFSNGSDDIDLGNYTGGFPKMIDDIIEGAFKKWTGKEYKPAAPFDSPLSLHNGRWSYIVYVLSNKNWQFGRIGRPITVSEKAAPALRYYDAHKVPQKYVDRSRGQPFDTQTPIVLDNCKIGFLMANGKMADYRDAINLHVDLIYEGPKLRFMPIMVDPDVRYPGGSGGS